MHEVVHEVWSLVMNKGAQLQSVGFWEQAVREWPTNPKHAEKYDVLTIRAIDALAKK